MSNLLTANLITLLKTADLIITVGNELRSDDAVGPYIFKALQTTNLKTKILNAGEKPENIIDKAIELKPNKVVIIDAADFGEKPGEARLIEQEHIPETTLSTHMFPLKIIAKIIEEDTKAKVYFLGIQPKSMALGESISPEVKETAGEIIEYLVRK